MKPARTTTLGKQSEHSTPPASLACKDPSPTPCPMDIIDAKITSIVDPHPIMAPLTNPKTKQESYGRKRVKHVSLATKIRTASKSSDTWQRNWTKILKNAKNRDSVIPRENSSQACRESSHSYSHRWWFPSWSCNTPSVRGMTSRGMPSTGSLDICQRCGLKQTSLRVPTTEEQQSCKKFSIWISHGSDICIGLLHLPCFIISYALNL